MTSTFYFDQDCSFCVQSAKLLDRIGGSDMEIAPLAEITPPDEMAQEKGTLPAAEIAPPANRQTATQVKASPKSNPEDAAQFRTGQPDAAQFRDSTGEVAYGHLAIAGALRTSPYIYVRWAAAAISTRPLAPLAEVVYGLVARYRGKISKVLVVVSRSHQDL